MTTNPHSILITFVTIAFLATLKAPASTGSNVPYLNALRDAQAVASMDGSWKVMRGAGLSMNPYYSEKSLLLVDTHVPDRIEPGMVIVYRDSNGDLVGHRVEASSPAGVVTRGLNNPSNDPALVPAAAIEGVVFGVLHTDGRVPAGDTLPVVMGKHAP